MLCLLLKVRNQAPPASWPQQHYPHFIHTHTSIQTHRLGAHQGVFWRAKASQAKQSQSGTSSDRPPSFLCCVLVCLCVCLASWSWHDMKDEDVECSTWRWCACVEVGQPITRTWERRAQEQECMRFKLDALELFTH